MNFKSYNIFTVTFVDKKILLNFSFKIENGHYLFFAIIR